MATLPKTIRIAGQVFGVRLVKNLRDESGQALLGRVNSITHEIELDTGCSRETQILTLLHESIHACLRIGKDHPYGPKIEEDIILALEPMLLSFLRSNKPFWK